MSIKFLKNKISRKLMRFNEYHNNLVELTYYSVVVHASDWSDSIYMGIDFDEADYIYKSYDEVHFYDIYVQMDKRIEYYKYLDFDNEPMESYPIEEYYDDDDIYELINDGEFEEVKKRYIAPANEKSDQLLSDVQRHYYEKYGNYKYNKFYLNDDVSVQLRISEHTENIHNIDRFGTSNYYISVVIANVDRTKDRFGMGNAFERRSNEYVLEFDGDDSKEDIIDEIEDIIDEIKYRESIDE